MVYSYVLCWRATCEISVYSCKHSGRFLKLLFRVRYQVIYGIVIPVIKIDAKAAEHAPDGCSAGHDASVIEFVIDSNIAKEYFGAANGLASWGNFNNYEYLRGNIQDIELVLDEKFEEGIVYEDHLTEEDSELAYGDQVEVIEGGY